MAIFDFRFAVLGRTGDEAGTALWIGLRPQAALADAQCSDDALPCPVHRNRATELTGHTAGNHLAAEARGFAGRGNGWTATFGPDNNHFAVIFGATNVEQAGCYGERAIFCGVRRRSLMIRANVVEEASPMFILGAATRIRLLSPTPS